MLLKKVSETSTPTDYGHILGTGDSSPSSSTKASSSSPEQVDNHMQNSIIYVYESWPIKYCSMPFVISDTLVPSASELIKYCSMPFVISDTLVPSASEQPLVTAPSVPPESETSATTSSTPVLGMWGEVFRSHAKHDYSLD